MTGAPWVNSESIEPTAVNPPGLLTGMDRNAVRALSEWAEPKRVDYKRMKENEKPDREGITPPGARGMPRGGGSQLRGYLPGNTRSGFPHVHMRA